MRRLVPFALTTVVILLSIGLLATAQRGSVRARLTGSGWLERVRGRMADAPEEA